MQAMAAELSADAGQLGCSCHSLDAKEISKDLFGIQAVEIV
jgi:hypothetical protein